MLLYGIVIVLMSLFIFDGVVSLLISLGGLIAIIIPLVIYSRYVYKQELNCK